MPRIVKCGLVQTSMACRVEESIETIRSANIEKTLGFIEQAGREGVQIVCLQEIFYRPVLLRRAGHHAGMTSTERIPDGPTIRLMQELARQHRMR